MSTNESFKINHDENITTGWEDMDIRNVEKDNETQDPVVGETFQVGYGVDVKEEFKRLTGEEWPGVKYQATTAGVDDDGYDSPIETWKISLRKADSESVDPIPGPDPIPSPTPEHGTSEPVPMPDPTPERGTSEPVPMPDPTTERGTLDSDPTPEPVDDEELEEARLKLAEYYARNRRLLVGENNRIGFEKARQEYQLLLERRLESLCDHERAISTDEAFNGMDEMIERRAEDINQQVLEFAGGSFENTDKTPEEIEDKREELRRSAVDEMMTELSRNLESRETIVSAAAVAEYIRQRQLLEAATIEALDHGTACRRMVHNILCNKWCRRGVAAATAVGVAGTAIAVGVGVHNGTLAVDVGYTAAGVAAGAGRGALGGGLMARQDSKTSAIRGYGDMGSEDISESATAQSLAAQSMSDYLSDNRTDLSSNRLKSALGFGVGGVMGAVASGIHVNSVVHENSPKLEVTEVPGKMVPELGQVDVPEGYGMAEVFTDLGGDIKDLDKAVKIATEAFDDLQDFVPGSNGRAAGVNGLVGKFAHTYPGKIADWPEQAQVYITKVADKWLAEGLISGKEVGHQRMYRLVDEVITKYAPNLFYNRLIQAEAAAVASETGNGMAGAGKTIEKATDFEANGIENPDDN